jgi:hypothetical protein
MRDVNASDTPNGTVLTRLPTTFSDPNAARPVTTIPNKGVLVLLSKVCRTNDHRARMLSDRCRVYEDSDCNTNVIEDELPKEPALSTISHGRGEIVLPATASFTTAAAWV